MFYMFQFLINILDRYTIIRMSGGSLAAVENIRKVRIEIRIHLNNLLKTIAVQQWLLIQDKFIFTTAWKPVNKVVVRETPHTLNGLKNHTERGVKSETPHTLNGLKNHTESGLKRKSRLSVNIYDDCELYISEVRYFPLKSCLSDGGDFPA